MDLCWNRADPAPAGQVSIGAAVEEFTGLPFGSPGTETASGIITRAVKAVPVKQTGYSGLMIPVLEDAVLTRRWTERNYGLDAIGASRPSVPAVLIPSGSPAIPVKQQSPPSLVISQH